MYVRELVLSCWTIELNGALGQIKCFITFPVGQMLDCHKLAHSSKHEVWSGLCEAHQYQVLERRFDLAE